jgi:exodeoxyribonuclease VII large subunit
MVADRRAATPSVAGELVVPVKSELADFITRQRKRLERSINSLLQVQKQRFLRASSCRFLVKPHLLIVERRNTVMNLARDLEARFARFYDKKAHRMALLRAKLDTLNPMVPLKRGYSMVSDASGNVLNSMKLLQSGQKLHLHFADGQALVTIDQLQKND